LSNGIKIICGQKYYKASSMKAIAFLYPISVFIHSIFVSCFSVIIFLRFRPKNYVCINKIAKKIDVNLNNAGNVNSLTGIGIKETEKDVSVYAEGVPTD